jgi:hypothetical protein
VEKVVNYMDDDIDRSKILIGVPTYGTEYQAMSSISGKSFAYTKVSAFNPQYALNVAKQYDITPRRNASGELYISYVPKEQTSMLPSNEKLSKLAPKDTESAYLAAAGALAYSKKEHKQAPVTFLTWSDAQAIEDKVTLAKKLGVAGVAIFKFDGSEDPDMWDSIASAATAKKNPSTSRDISTVTSVPVTPTMPTTPATVPPVASTGTSFTADLQFGDNNADVLRLQTLLSQKGYLKATPNGNFGPATLAAVRAWQKASALPSTGYFGPMSRAAIGK